jgi:glucokinase
MSLNAVIGVDLGGTNIRAGKVLDGLILNEASCLVFEKGEGKTEVVDSIISVIEQVFDKDIKGIGMGIPSLLDRELGIVYDVTNIPSWDKVALKSILENHFKVPVYLDNDANCFALGERYFGKGRKIDDFVGLTLGTGLGSGIINKGKILSDKNCGSGEFGMISYRDSIYEDYCSSKFFISKHNTTGFDTFEKAKLGDPKALEIFTELGIHLGKAIKTILFSVDPELIIMGGSIAKAHDYFHASLMQEISDFPFSQIVKNIKIEYSDLKNPAILGAAGIYLDRVV